MPLYTFFPMRPDGVADTFEAVDYRSDADVLPKAVRVLGEHPEATHVVVWQGDRLVLNYAAGAARTEDRPQPEPRPAPRLRLTG